MVTIDSIKVTDSLKFVTPKGNIVYGGGGIIPDIFVPKDTSIEKETLEYISRSGFASYFVFEYLESKEFQIKFPIQETYLACLYFYLYKQISSISNDCLQTKNKLFTYTFSGLSC